MLPIASNCFELQLLVVAFVPDWELCTHTTPLQQGDTTTVIGTSTGKPDRNLHQHGLARAFEIPAIYDVRKTARAMYLSQEIHNSHRDNARHVRRWLCIGARSQGILRTSPGCCVENGLQG